MPPRSSQKTKFGLTVMPTRYNNITFPAFSNRKILMNFGIKRNGNAILGNITEDIIEKAEEVEGQEVELPEEMSGKGILGAFSKVLDASKKFKEGIDLAKKVGSVVVDVAGPFVSKAIEKKSQKNPNFGSGFDGERHLILPTKFGLTRANFCGRLGPC